MEFIKEREIQNILILKEPSFSHKWLEFTFSYFSLFLVSSWWTIWTVKDWIAIALFVASNR